MPYIILNYPEDNFSCAYWQSKRGYFYCQSKGNKPKRVSEKEYMSAYEMYYDL